MELEREPEKKRNTQESEHERWAGLDKKIEMARARHKLARLVMGTIFLVLSQRNISLVLRPLYACGACFLQEE